MEWKERSVENLSYDLLTALQTKLEGLNAYDQYIQDCQKAGDQTCQQLFQQLKQQETQQAQELRSTIEQLVQQGKFH
jgi:bacterioferritin (cytochrome b1)